MAFLIHFDSLCATLLTFEHCGLILQMAGSLRGFLFYYIYIYIYFPNF
jgi:hypothetical protein